MRLCLFFAGLVLSTQACAQLMVLEQKDIPYTLSPLPLQRLDLFIPIPMTSKPRPALVFVHGGGWTGGSKEDYSGFARYYASKGFVCISINYRLAPVSIWPAQIDDVQASVRWLRKNATALGVNPLKIGAVGASAGGHLVQFLALADTFNHIDPSLRGFSSRVQVVIDFVGLSLLWNRNSWHPDFWSLITQLIGPPHNVLSPTYLLASPINYVDAADSPLVLLYGALDNVVPISQGRMLAERLRQKGTPFTYYELPNRGARLRI